jgi:hypothetical protein
MNRVILSLVLAATAGLFWFLHNGAPKATTKIALEGASITLGFIACWIVYSEIKFKVTLND